MKTKTQSYILDLKVLEPLLQGLLACQSVDPTNFAVRELIDKVKAARLTEADYKKAIHVLNYEQKFLKEEIDESAAAYVKSKKKFQTAVSGMEKDINAIEKAMA